MSGADYYQLAFVRGNPGLLRLWSDLETSLLRKRLIPELRAPIFVCGLARSGTTLVTHILHSHADTGSFRYRDLPFVEVPYLWGFAGKVYYGNQPLKQREHGDKLSINPDSPDAFEELLWKSNLPDYDDGGFCAVRDESYSNPQLEERLPLAMKKALYVRGKKTRYLSKGNYNLFRLRYMLKLFPDARIILCVRDPFTHARSLARVHAKFMEMASQDKYFAKRLEILGHYEFGPLRRVIHLPEGRHAQTLAHWEKGEDYLGYLLQWDDVYSFARRAYAGNPNVLWHDSSSMVSDKEETVRKILRFCELREDGIDLKIALDEVAESTSYKPEASPYDAQVRATHAALLDLCR